nr:CDP-diacylglycerol--glycerol-3-phosphate 3-phosphatidyltransferase [Phycisphaerae bacterium]NIR64690.1 CDP-diacylglycerol--glycerol-3-phosphate 3-phosphatidyltransferase [candidate division Zixibacteria bacterium]NIW44538.1 CDP-diacylglycerol--glycerol-3-phosphate 3-phosphatidyltransferase [Gammaproteobacteria bacterium]NIU13649.1 CDP-diacylglycerol--glycerol-3-phosphate 3-phosphatidyltransferase [candidate division Zixibacteria bacterium]NIV05701.1 CDP-diacylglycerol--glycerol-3-phosphate 3
MRSSRPILRINVPTILTLSRIVLIPLFIYVTLYVNDESKFWGAVVFSIASITDFLDGYLARRMGQVTNFGKIVDPIADKFLVITALVLLVYMRRLSVIIAVIIICREVLVTALRMVALARDIVIQA